MAINLAKQEVGNPGIGVQFLSRDDLTQLGFTEGQADFLVGSNGCLTAGKLSGFVEAGLVTIGNDGNFDLTPKGRANALLNEIGDASADPEGLALAGMVPSDAHLLVAGFGEESVLDSTALEELFENGYIAFDADGKLQLTDAGRQEAMKSLAGPDGLDAQELRDAGLKPQHAGLLFATYGNISVEQLGNLLSEGHVEFDANGDLQLTIAGLEAVCRQFFNDHDKDANGLTTTELIMAGMDPSQAAMFTATLGDLTFGEFHQLVTDDYIAFNDDGKPEMTELGVTRLSAQFVSEHDTPPEDGVLNRAELVATGMDPDHAARFVDGCGGDGVSGDELAAAITGGKVRFDPNTGALALILHPTGLWI